MKPERRTTSAGPLEPFGSAVVDGVRAGRLGPAGSWLLPGGQLVLPDVFGFCRGVKRALAMAGAAMADHAPSRGGGEIVLLGEIIHNPWVNDYFRRCGVRILTRKQCDDVERYVQPGDIAIIPAFGLPLPIERRLAKIGCRTVDCSCGDVIRLWQWSSREAHEGFGVLIFGRAMHDETVVTKTRLAAAGGKYLVVENLQQVRSFAEMITSRTETSASLFQKIFPPHATNARDIQPFEKLAQVSQTTMLYDDTRLVREVLSKAFARRFGPQEAAERLRFQPTVCRATQDRQNAAVELCRSGCDLVIVVGGFASSNTRHLYELARQYAPAYLIEDARAIISADLLRAWSPETHQPCRMRHWLGADRPVRIGVLAGASSPEIVIGQVLQKLAKFLR